MAKQHVVVPEEEWKFKRQRQSDQHIQKCSTGYPKAALGKTPRWLEIHHILCVKACSNATFPPGADEKFLKSCMAITEWCINDFTYPVGPGESNLIGLPTKQAYVEDKTFAWDLVPCHQVDHDIYLEEVNKYVRDKIWKTLEKAQEEKACEQLTPENIKAKFTTGCKIWRTFLTVRGKYFGGAKACLDYCLKGQPHPIINDQNWYVPFSMAPNKTTIRPREKPKPLSPLVREALLAIK